MLVSCCWKLTVFFSCSWVVVVAGFTPLSSPSTSKQADATLPSRDFWRKERSAEEVKSRVLACLADVADRQTIIPTNDATVATERVEVLSAEPPLVLIHNFLSESMCNDIIGTCLETDKMKESTVGSTQKMSETRTSSTVWLKDPECQDPLRLIAEKVSMISGLPPTNMENLQVVKYEPGQEFNMHTDHMESFK
jgi:hypothetical protein